AVEAGQAAGGARRAGAAAPLPRRPHRPPQPNGGTMKRRRTQQYGMGRVFKRRSRHTGKLLSTWWIAYSVDGARVRESTNTEDRGAAVRLLRDRLTAVSDGAAMDPARERLTVAVLLDGLLAFYDRQGHRSRESAASQLNASRAAHGA